MLDRVAKMACLKIQNNNNMIEGLNSTIQIIETTRKML